MSFRERTNIAAVPAMGVVAESMMALVLANEALRKFGGDSLAEIVRNRTATSRRSARHPRRRSASRRRRRSSATNPKPRPIRTASAAPP